MNNFLLNFMIEYFLENIKEVINRLQEIQPGWSRLKEFDEFYQKNKNEVDRLNEILIIRISRFEQIVKQMERNEWLTEDQNRWMKEDTQLSQEQSTIANKLNNKN